MFYCEACRVKNEWPRAYTASQGPCEMCGKHCVCYDAPSDQLPVPPKAAEPPGLPQFTGDDSRCPKCGYPEAKSEWAPACGAQHHDAQPHRVNAPERLVRTCIRCGYEWDEAPLDAPNAFEAEMTRGCIRAMLPDHPPQKESQDETTT